MRPGPALVTAALVWFLLGAVGFFSDIVSLIWLYSGITLFPVIIIDSLVLYFLGDRFELKREIPVSLAQDESVRIKIEVQNSGKGFLPFRIMLWDLHPPSMEPENHPAAFPAALDRKLFTSGQSIFFEYTLLPRERGQWFFRGIELLLSSPLRFWRLKAFHPCTDSVRIYPNFNKIKASAGTYLRGLLELSGVKNVRIGRAHV